VSGVRRSTQGMCKEKRVISRRFRHSTLLLRVRETSFEWKCGWGTIILDFIIEFNSGGLVAQSIAPAQEQINVTSVIFASYIVFT